jgi:hypothetical protein
VKAISVKTFKKLLNRFKRDFGSRKVHEISTQEISEWLKAQTDAKTGERWTANTQTKVRGSLVTLSKYAQKTLNAIPDVGDTAFQNVSAPNEEERPEVEIYTPAELGALFAAAVEHDIELIPALVAGRAAPDGC